MYDIASSDMLARKVVLLRRGGTPTSKNSDLVEKTAHFTKTDSVLTKCPDRPYEGLLRGKLDRDGAWGA